MTRSSISRKDAAETRRTKGVIVPDADPDIATLVFEQALAELEQIVDKLEKGSIPLEDSIALYARGEALKAHCEALLKSAEQRVEKITLGANGGVSGTEPLDVE